MEKEIFDPFFADFLKFSLKTQEPRENLKKELKKYYKDIKSICEKRPEKWTVDTITGKETDNTSLLSSSFVPEIIGKEIEKCEKFYIFKTTIDNNFLVTVKFCVNNDETVDDYCLYFVKIYAWLKFIYKYSDKKQKKFTLYLYLSDYKKELPKEITGILDQINCNTAVTYACAKNGECLIYRKEEWFKVLLHETMHSLCLDFSGVDYKNIKDQIKELFPVKSKFEISESYSEFWAVFLNTTFKSASVSNTEEAFLENWEIMMFTENIFTMFQVTKILDFLEIVKYESLYKENTYTEKTHVFEYYIIKMLFLFNYNDFFDLCYNNNKDTISFTKTPAMLDKIFEFIKKNYNDEDLQNNLENMREYFVSFSQGDYKYKDIVLKTMRMTLF